VGFSVLCVDRDVTYTFIDDVVGELARLAPGPYFHIGGDEVRKLSPEAYVAFVERAQAIVAGHGKSMIGWDEIAAATLAPTTLVQHWRPRGASGAAVARGTKVILSTASRMYLDMKYDARTALGLDWAGLVGLRQAYDWDPATLLRDVPEVSIVGVEAPLWS